MKSKTKKTRQFLYIVILLSFLILTGLSLPRQVGALQSTPEPTPTITPVYLPGEEPLKSGETGGLMLGAAIILLIIFSGVIIQGVLHKNNPDIPE